MAETKRRTLLIGVAMVLLVVAGVSLAWTMGGSEASPAIVEFERARVMAEAAPERMVGSGPVDSNVSGSGRLGSQEAVVQPDESPVQPDGTPKPRKDAPRRRNRTPSPVPPEEAPQEDDAGGAKQKPPMG